jgi:DNA-directed RNA polymerase subunit RPC12/RpoP
LALAVTVLILFSMAVENLGEALGAGWRITARCAWGKQEAMVRTRECVYRHELDLETLVWTRGATYPLARLESRLKCPRCGSRRVALLFHVPTIPKEKAATLRERL